ncbi:MAG: Carboxypeptidase regulatory-like domain, partial [Acidobacteriota bacterium]|nr:Carboxypeptidase regulatory-like domain [Acidobacteriota bacterium]
MLVRTLALWMFSLALACCAPRALVSAQETGAQGVGVRGVVVDLNGASVPDALVVLVSARSVEATLKTDAGGRFDFGFAEPHGFTLTVTARGFGRFERSWKEGEGSDAPLRVVLAPPSLAERVTVTASRTETRLGETAASVVVLDERELESAAALTADDLLRQV